MSELGRFSELLAEAGPWTFAYVDGTAPNPQVEEEAKRESVRRRLAEAGAPEPDIEAAMSSLNEKSGLEFPSARYVLVRDGETVLDATLPGERFGDELVGHDSVPPILPMLRHAVEELQCLVVETARDGATLRWAHVGAVPERIGDVEGRTEELQKVRAGGLSHARYQRSAEESWKMNQREVAETVDRLVRERRPAFVVMSGDVRARQMLWEDLSDASRELIVEVDSHTRAAGSDADAVEEAIEDEAEQRQKRERTEATDRAEAGGGRRGARGRDAVMAALQQAQVDTLILDARSWRTDQTLDALAGAPWVGDGDELDVGTHGPLPVPEALARAALLTDARVIVDEDEPSDPDEPRSNREPRPPLALLRWPEDG